MKHAVIVAHPNANSFNLAMAHAYQAAAEALGHRVVLRDLYRMGFDPRLGEAEVPRPGGFQPADDVLSERATIGGADVFVFVYPLWFNSPPAMLKGYLERVFGMGFGYGEAEAAQPLLAGRRMVSITSSGAPKAWMVETGAWDAVSKLFDQHFATVCGLSVVEHLHQGQITPGITEDAVDGCKDRVAELVRRHFGPAQG